MIDHRCLFDSVNNRNNSIKETQIELWNEVLFQSSIVSRTKYAPCHTCILSKEPPRPRLIMRRCTRPRRQLLRTSCPLHLKARCRMWDTCSRRLSLNFHRSKVRSVHLCREWWSEFCEYKIDIMLDLPSSNAEETVLAENYIVVDTAVWKCLESNSLRCTGACTCAATICE